MNHRSSNDNLPKVLWASERSEHSTDQCDCACADTRLSHSDPSSICFQPDLLCHSSPGTRLTPLTDNWRLALQPLGRFVPVVINEPASEFLDYFHIPRCPEEVVSAFSYWDSSVVEDAMQWLIITELIIPKGCTSVHPPNNTSTLTAWLHLTDRCNLRCAYCYLPHFREDMPSETGRAAVDAAFRSAEKQGFQQIKLKYSGGEPLIRFPLVLELHQYAQALAEQNGLSLDGVVLSNGTLLTTEIVEALKTTGIRLMISLDGLGDIHDSQRSYASGRSSFADVAEAVELALTHSLTPDISITVSGRTAAGLPEVIAWVLERDLPFSLNFYRENDFSTTHTDLAFEEETILNGMAAVFKVIEANLPHRSLLASLMDRANLIAPHYRTCGVGQNYLVFDQRGQVAKCQMQIGKTIATVHNDDPLTLIRADQNGIQNLSFEEKESCRDCQWRYWCAGGCPLETYRVTGRYDVKSPHCNIYQALFPEVLRLEGLRLLKYQDDPQVVQKIVL